MKNRLRLINIKIFLIILKNIKKNNIELAFEKILDQSMDKQRNKMIDSETENQQNSTEFDREAALKMLMDLRTNNKNFMKKPNKINTVCTSDQINESESPIEQSYNKSNNIVQASIIKNNVILTFLRSNLIL